MKSGGSLDQFFSGGATKGGQVLDTFWKVNLLGIVEELNMGCEIGKNNK